LKLTIAFKDFCKFSVQGRGSAVGVRELSFELLGSLDHDEKLLGEHSTMSGFIPRNAQVLSEFPLSFLCSSDEFQRGIAIGRASQIQVH
jgi:hypothetical protein